MARRYAESPHLRFLLRTAYLPLASLRGVITAGYHDFLQVLGDLFCAGLVSGRSLADIDVMAFEDAYVGIVDSLRVELVYAYEAAFERRWMAL